MIDSTGRGVLTDWDLSHRAGEPHRGGERTGPTTFMALELLCREYSDGRMERQYHHDLEAFIWILPWVFLQFEGQRRTNRQLAPWETGDFEACRREKGGVSLSYSPANSWCSKWKGFATYLLSWIKMDKGATIFRSRRRRPIIAPAPADIFNTFCKMLYRRSDKYPAICDILRELVALPTFTSSHPPEQRPTTRSKKRAEPS